MSDLINITLRDLHYVMLVKVVLALDWHKK